MIPAVLALIKRVALRHEVHMFALAQEAKPGSWELVGADIHNVGVGLTASRAVMEILRERRSSPFHSVQSMWSGARGLVAVAAADFCVFRVLCTLLAARLAHCRTLLRRHIELARASARSSGLARRNGHY